MESRYFCPKCRIKVDLEKAVRQENKSPKCPGCHGFLSFEDTGPNPQISLKEILISVLALLGWIPLFFLLKVFVHDTFPALVYLGIIWGAVLLGVAKFYLKSRL